ncbi:MAG TPA: hypothetical protein VIJ50_07460 [Solirubrobacteraceae bacterium]
MLAMIVGLPLSPFAFFACNPPPDLPQMPVAELEHELGGGPEPHATATLAFQTQLPDGTTVEIENSANVYVVADSQIRHSSDGAGTFDELIDLCDQPRRA